MGWLRELPSGRVQAYYRDPHGRQRSRTFGARERRKARDWITEQEARVTAGQWTHAGRTTVNDWLTVCLDSKVVGAGWDQAQRGYLRIHVSPHLGHIHLDHLTSSQVAGWVKLLAAKLAPATVGHVFQMLDGGMDAAIREGLIRRNPCEGVRLPERRDYEPVYLTRVQVGRLADAVPERNRALILFAAYTGMRWGEIAGLKRDRVDFLRKTVTVMSTLTEVSGHHGTGKAKSKNSQRVIPLPDLLLPVLAEHYQHYAGPEYVFVSARGMPMRRSWLARTMRPAAISCGLPERLRFHDLRHTFVATYLGLGVDIFIISRWLGHSSVTVTARVYAKLIKEAELRAMDAVNAQLVIPRVPSAHG